MPVPKSIKEFRAGALTFALEHGGLRGLSCYGEQVISLIGVALRDPNWGTVPLRMGKLSVQDQGDRQRISYTLQNHIHNELIFHWSIALTLMANHLSLAVVGECLAPYRANRAGMYLRIVPSAAAGQPARVYHPDGLVTATSFPVLVSPHQPMRQIGELHWHTPAGARIELSLSGETFELEDERNWTDDAFKLYGPPLDRPFPVAYHPGDRITQRLVLSVYLGQEGFHPLPRLHACAPLSGYEPEASFAITRVDIFPGRPIPPVLRAPVHLAFLLGIDPVAELHELLSHVPPEGISFVSVATVEEKMLTGAVLRDLLPLLRRSFPHIPRGFGSAFYFTELNRFPPPSDLDYDFVYFGNAALVHETDERSVIETAAGQAATVRSARARYPRQEVWVSPLSLSPRFNPNRTDGQQVMEAAGRPNRQEPNSFVTGWVLRCLLYLAEAGCATVELLDTEAADDLVQWIQQKGITAIRRISPAGQRDETEVELRAGQSIYHILAEHTAPYRLTITSLTDVSTP